MRTSSNDASDISDFEYGETPTKFDLNNTEHILKLDGEVCYKLKLFKHINIYESI